MKKILLSVLFVVATSVAFAAGHTVAIGSVASATCFGMCNGSATATVSGGVGPFSYGWSPSGGSSATASGLCAGTYTVTVTDNSDMSTANTTVTITQPAALSVTVGGGGSVCSGACTTVTSSLTGGIPPYNFNWAPGGGPGSSITVCPTSGTSYTVTVTDANGCTATSSHTVAVIPTAIVTVPANITVCDGGSIPTTAFTSTPIGAAFTWTNSNTSIGIGASGAGNLPAFTGTNTGSIPVTSTITVTPTYSGCVGTSNSYTITVNPTPVVTVPSSFTTCNGSTVPTGYFTSNVAGSSFSWTNSNTSIGVAAAGASLSLPSFTAINPGSTPVSGTITVTCVGAGCASLPTTYSITVDQSDDASFSYPSSLYCYSAANPIPTITGTTGGVFSSTAGLIFISASTGEIDIAASTLGTYTVTYTTSGSCSATSSSTFTIAPVPAVSLTSSNNTCLGYCISLSPSVTGGTGGITYSWMPASGLSAASISNPMSCPAATTTYTVAVTDMNGCASTASTVVYVDNLSISSITTTNPSSCGVCDGTATVIPYGGSAPFIYLWNDPAVQTTQTANALCAGVYDSVQVTDVEGCTVSGGVIIPSSTATSNFTMVPDSANAMTFWAFNSSTGAGLTYSWDFGDGGVSTLANPNYTYGAAGTMNVCLAVASSTGCADTLCQSVTVNASPASCLALFNVAHDTASANPNAYIIANLSYGSSLTYLWDFGDGATSTLQLPTHSYGGTGAYQICLTVDNGAGCNQMYCDSITWVDSLGHSSIPLTVTVIDATPPSLTTGIANLLIANEINMYPNPFEDITTFEISGNKTGTYSFEMTDVLGKKVKSLNGISEKQFSVSRNGLENGIYFYKISSKENVIGVGKLVIK